MRRVFKKIYSLRLTITSVVLFLSIVVFTSKPTQQLNIDWHLYDKLLHFLVFGLLSLNVLGAIMELKKSMSPKKVIIISISISLLYGIMTEIIQYFIPYRSCSLFDLLADFVGISLFCLLYYLLSGIKPFNSFQKE